MLDVFFEAFFASILITWLWIVKYLQKLGFALQDGIEKLQSKFPNFLYEAESIGIVKNECLQSHNDIDQATTAHMFESTVMPTDDKN